MLYVNVKPDTKEHKKGVIYYKGGTKRKILFKYMFAINAK